MSCLPIIVSILHFADGKDSKATTYGTIGAIPDDE